jgi:hypothetical protein
MGDKREKGLLNAYFSECLFIPFLTNVYRNPPNNRCTAGKPESFKITSAQL